MTSPAPSAEGGDGVVRRLTRAHPLDRISSIRTKLGLLVVASIVATALLTWFGLQVLGWWPRYTLPVAVLLSLAVTQVLARGMTSPLRQMTAAAADMAAGRPPRPVRATSRDEVGELARAFTAMSADLAAADAQRRELLANVGHELRTPVCALRAQLENLVDGVREPDETCLAELLACAERLGGLVDDLLDLARADAGVRPLQPDTVDVDDLVREVIDELAATHPGVRMMREIEVGLVVVADRARLRQVLVNLLDNAARHGGQADVRIVGGSMIGGRMIDGRMIGGRTGGSDDGRVVIDVLDAGPGIPVPEREKVFQRFHRGPSQGRDADGDGSTGLGLAIARWAVTLHGGTIAVRTPPDGRGTCIRVELPAAGPAPLATGRRTGDSLSDPISQRSRRA